MSDAARFSYEATLLNANARCGSRAQIARNNAPTIADASSSSGGRSLSADSLQRLELSFAEAVNARYNRDSAYQKALQVGGLAFLF